MQVHHQFENLQVSHQLTFKDGHTGKKATGARSNEKNNP
jgi:hypothetical protein